MTTNETLFFRDQHPFDALRSHMLPALVRARGKERRLRIWCAAASTGQEPYSVAITLRENFPELADWDVKLLATDLNCAVLARARSGRYSTLEVKRGLPASLLLKYFRAQGDEWQLKDEVRRMVQFSELNLLDAWGTLGPLDIVLMRNVLIYFDVETKKRILGQLRGQLARDGYLLLGGAETTANLDDAYVPLRLGAGVYYRLKP